MFESGFDLDNIDRQVDELNREQVKLMSFIKMSMKNI